MSRRGVISAAVPPMWTGMIAFVRGVIARLTAAGSMVRASGSTSTRTGVAPTCIALIAVEANV